VQLTTQLQLAQVEQVEQLTLQLLGVYLDQTQYSLQLPQLAEVELKVMQGV
jgi:hypothetical protein